MLTRTTIETYPMHADRHRLLAFPEPFTEFVELTYAEPFCHFAPMKP